MPPVTSSRTQPAICRHRRIIPLGIAVALCLSLTAVCGAGRAVAATAASATGWRQEVNLSALIDGLQSKYARMQGLAADFTQNYAGADGRTASEAGHLILKRPGKARWEYSQPERKLFVSDG